MLSNQESLPEHLNKFFFFLHLNYFLFFRSTSSNLHTSMFQEDLGKKPLFPNSFWISKKDEKRNHKRNNAPCKRWGHSVILFENQMFLFGGSGSNNNARNWETIYILNCDTWDWEKVCPNDALGNNTPEPRDSHACVRIGHNMFIFGGSNGENPLNDMFAFNLVSKTWNKIDESGEIPTPREGHSGVALLDRYFFIFGGWDGKNIFQNCYLFDSITKKWKILEYLPGSEPLPRESHSCALLRDKIYIFGGQGTSIKKKDNYYNDLFRLKINIDKSLEKINGVWEKLSSKNGFYPSPRTSHSIASYQDRYLIVIGGEGYGSTNNDVISNNFMTEEKIPTPKKNTKKLNIEENVEESDEDDDDHPPCFPKSDIWIYDIEEMNWNLLEVKNFELFMPRFTHSCVVYKESLIIFGGLKDLKNSIDDLMVLMLEDGETKKPIHLCSCCKKILDSKPNNHEIVPSDSGKICLELKKTEAIITEENENELFEDPNNFQPFISLGLLPNLINLIEWPFAAFGMLVDNGSLIAAKDIRISWEKKYRYGYNPNKILIRDQMHVENFIQVEYNGNCNILNSHLDVLESLSNLTETSKSENAQKLFIKNLKIAGIRLGEAVLLVIKCEKNVHLFYLATNLRRNPDLSDYIIFNCAWNMSTLEILSSPDSFFQMKKLILNDIGFVLSEQDILDLPNTTFFIFNLRKFDLKNKNVYELNRKGNDVCLTFPKILERKEKKHNNFSLQRYLECFFLAPQKNFIEIYLNDKKITFNNILKSSNLKCFVDVTNDIPNELKSFTKNMNIFFENVSKTKENNFFLQKDQENTKVMDDETNVRLNNGFLLYWNNRLINRLECVRKAKNFGFYGYIELLPSIEIDFSKSVIYC